MTINVNLFEFFEKEIRKVTKGDKVYLRTFREIFNRIDTVHKACILLGGIMLADKTSMFKVLQLIDILQIKIQENERKGKK